MSFSKTMEVREEMERRSCSVAFLQVALILRNKDKLSRLAFGEAFIVMEALCHLPEGYRPRAPKSHYVNGKVYENMEDLIRPYPFRYISFFRKLGAFLDSYIDSQHIVALYEQLSKEFKPEETFTEDELKYGIGFLTYVGRNL